MIKYSGTKLTSHTHSYYLFSVVDRWFLSLQGEWVGGKVGLKEASFLNK